MTATQDTTTGVGRVARVTGPVVDVEFPAEHMPELFNALNVDVTFDAGEGDVEHRILTDKDRPGFVIPMPQFQNFRDNCRYNAEGVAGLKTRPRSGRAPRLTSLQIGRASCRERVSSPV